MDGKMQCRKCRRTLPLRMFYRNSRYQSGFRPVCKGCIIKEQEPTAAKQCSKCKVIKYAQSFRKDARAKDGLQGVCKECKTVNRKRQKDLKVCKGCNEQKEKWLYYSEGDCSTYSRRHAFCLECKIKKTTETPNAATCKSCLGKFPPKEIEDSMCQPCHSWYFARYGRETYKLIIERIRRK